MSPSHTPLPQASATEVLRASPIFRRATDDDLALLAADTRWVDHAAGQDLVRQGEPADTLLLIAQGQAQVLLRGDSGRAHEINRLGPGDSIGEMALFDPEPRSATVRALEPVRVLALPLARWADVATQRPSLVPVLLDVGALVAQRLRQSSETAVAAADRALAEERTRTMLGRFTLLLMLAYTLYTWLLGTAVQVKAALGRSEFVTVPFILICCSILFVFMRVSGYPARFFGLSLQDAGRHLRQAVLWTLPWLAGAVVLKWLLVLTLPAMQGLPVFQMLSAPPPGLPASSFQPGLALAYVLFAPFQELIYRGGIQGPLSHFIAGRWRQPLAILGANIIFSSAHLYVSPGLAVMAFVAGLFWGWMYARQGTLVGVSVSHILLGFWAFEVVDLGVLE
jgi:CRP/FNR family transcriptional regulator, cyclic AMP receptor protein